jgi:hypothetical protein
VVSALGSSVGGTAAEVGLGRHGAGSRRSMSDIHEAPGDDEISYPDAREDQAEYQALVEEKDGDVDEAIEAQQEGEEPDEPRRNASMP